MEFNIVVAPNLETLAAEVSGLFSKGWKLKGSIVEHKQGYAQQMTRKPSDLVRVRTKANHTQPAPKRTKWIE
ncbi:hypothetical protein FVR03_21830 [Pontibacter qinzhouensis]|uniref:DUF1737 domain-containing protein n=1 Tax=Pontibacter qinzhouensis TaxID=2603253 RepID=A0A5C8IZC2_9BACT|nr:hypothetical protein [Pontibacter qinzhouensis]TXK26404.1 hypothetical protein FVR03_21830 [Pontibacter qinzhouensis]